MLDQLLLFEDDFSNSGTSNTEKNDLVNYGIKKKYFDNFELDDLRKIWSGLINSKISDSIYKHLNPFEMIALYVGIDRAKKGKVSYDKNNFSKTISVLVGYSFKDDNLRSKIIPLRDDSKEALDDGPYQLISRMEQIDENSKNQFMESLSQPLLPTGWSPEDEAKTFNSEKESYKREIYNKIKWFYNVNNRS